MDEPPTIADQLARLADIEERFQATLEAEKLESLAEFAAGAGHEINNPLTVISGRAQLLLREETDPERQHVLALISAQAMRVHEMIADMMLFARPPRPEFQSVELIELVDEVVESLRPRCTKQDTAIARVGPSDSLVIEADPIQLAVALRAICQNSIEALGSGGHIELSAEKVSGTFYGNGVEDGVQKRFLTLFSAAIRVSDDGPGIKPEERRHIFDPFFSARQAGRGLGLGLSKAWRIVTNHGGRIEVDEPTERGTTFTVTLPTNT